MTEARYQKYTCVDTWGRRLLRGLYSSLIPGTGQLVAGARVTGYILVGLLAAFVVAFVLVVLLAQQRGDEFMAWLIEPSVLLGILIADIVLMIFRLYAVVDAVRLRPTRWNKANGRSHQLSGTEGSEGAVSGLESGGGKSSKNALALGIAGLVLLVGFTVTPHIFIGYSYIYKSYDTLRTVFWVEDTTTTTVPVTTTLPAGSGSTVSTEPPVTVTTAIPVDVDAGDDGRLTILFSGSDAGVGRSGGRADTNIVASLDMNTGRIALFSIPRNTGDAPLSEAAQDALGMRVYRNWLTGLYGSAQRHPELAPEGQDPGAITMRDTISMILGIHIDYYAVVDMLGFVNLVDIMGGVDVYLDEPLHMSISPPTEEEDTLVYNLPEGISHLDGRQALAFARTRHDSSDYVRMGRQRCVIAALMSQTNMTELIWNFPALMDVIKNFIRTDIPIDALQELVKLRTKLNTEEMVTLGFTPPKYTKGLNGNTEQLGWRLNYDLIQETVQRALLHPEELLAESTSTGLDTGDCWKKPLEQ